MGLSGLARNVRTAAADPRLMVAWAGWRLGLTRDHPLPDGGRVGGFATFTDYWCFRPPSPAERALIERSMPADGVAVDVGANAGAFAVTLGRLRPAGRVFAFEPVPRAFDMLTANLTRNRLANVAARNQAVGDRAGTVFMTAATTGSAANRVTTAGRGVAVPCVTLDDFLAAERLDRVDFLKVDVEGYEAAVLDGLAGALAAGRVRVLLLEVIPELLRRQGSSAGAVFDRLHAHGYRVYRLGPDGRPADAVAADAVGTAGDHDWNYLAQRAT